MNVDIPEQIQSILSQWKVKELSLHLMKAVSESVNSVTMERKRILIASDESRFDKSNYSSFRGSVARHPEGRLRRRLLCRSRGPQISGFTFGVINRSQFIGRRYFSDFSLRFVMSSLLSLSKFTMLASLSDTFGAFFLLSVRD